MATVASDVQSKRIVTLDIIRGIAVMGIFSVNVIAFAMIESAYFNPAVYGGHTGADLALWAANMIVIDGKMRTLFSMLFGASMLLVYFMWRRDPIGLLGQAFGWFIYVRNLWMIYRPKHEPLEEAVVGDPEPVAAEVG